MVGGLRKSWVSSPEELLKAGEEVDARQMTEKLLARTRGIVCTLKACAMSETELDSEHLLGVLEQIDGNLDLLSQVVESVDFAQEIED
ncbi:hypothetical protein [Desulfosediminicola sp.]|uniref:hypothetical protein n=1 Tax=Desulfosediminicola sp. TaxID=2886825 RepID=UPI003AF29C64